jgi:hypothetical protein
MSTAKKYSVGLGTIPVTNHKNTLTNTNTGSNENIVMQPVSNMKFPLSVTLEEFRIVPKNYRVEVNRVLHWGEIHAWCNEHFGNRYTWNGNTFWFEKEQDAILFKLKWE